MESDKRQDLLERMMEVLHRETGGDQDRSYSMWSIGEELGTDRNLTEDLAMELVGEGLVEIKTLSGGLGLTQAGAERGRAAQGGQAVDMATLIEELKGKMDSLKLSPEQWNDYKIDLAVLELQMQRSAPLPEVLKSTLQALRNTLDVINSTVDTLDAFIDTMDGS